MDITRFENITRCLPAIPSRRNLLRGFVSIGIGLAAFPRQDAAEAKRKKRRKHHHKQERTIPCSESCSDAFALCLERPEGHPLCAPSTLTSNCVNCATDQDCLATPQTPYCTTGATERATNEPIPLDEFCPEMIVGVCSQIPI